jgi:hypothetical protein
MINARENMPNNTFSKLFQNQQVKEELAAVISENENEKNPSFLRKPSKGSSLNKAWPVGREDMQSIQYLESDLEE